MGCLLFKESKLNFLENLKTEGYINSRRELTFEKDVHKYLNDLVDRLNLNYDLNIKSLATIKEVKIKTGKDFSRDSEKFILTPIEESFEQIDNRRKELGIYEDRISIGEYNKTQIEKISNQEKVNRLNFFNGDVALYEQEQKEFDNEANLIRFSDLRQELRVQEGKLNFKKGKINDFEILSENSVMNKEISQQEAFKIFNKKYKTPQEKQDLSIYFANHFLNSVYDREGLLYLGYTRFLRYGVATPKLLVVKDNGRKNPFFQYNNVVVIGLKQIEKFVDNLKTPTFEKFENLINVVAQEEIIHLYADYLLDNMDIDNIYNEMTEKDISQIKKIYGNSSIQKENIVHEYVRMVVQQKVFGRTTEYESFTLSNALMSMFERLIEELNDFLSTIIGSTNTKKAIQDVIDFTKGNFSEELDKKIIARIFEKGQILEANLENLGEQLTNQLKPFIDESNKIGDESIDERLKKYEESIKIPNNVKSKVLEKIEKETEKVKEKLLSLGLKQEGNKFELITNSYATFKMKLKELENVNAIISTNKTSDFYQIIARLKNVDSTMELKKQGELPFTPIEVKQVIQEQQFLNDVADNVFEGLSEEEKQILKKKIENGDYDLNCRI